VRRAKTRQSGASGGDDLDGALGGLKSPFDVEKRPVAV
jgi:hypothetical protein